MIARMWRGWVRTDRLDEYLDILERTGMTGYRQTPGNAGAQLLTRDAGAGRTELITLSWWSDLDAIRAFAGDDIDVAKYYPEDDAYLLDRETTVAHFEVSPPVGPEPWPREPADAVGFTTTRVLLAHPAEVFRHFVEAEAFARWFVVDGYQTPAAQVRLDVRPGGAISGVIVSDQDGSEIPFSARYGDVEAPHRVQLSFTDPDELVTITLFDLGDAGCQLTYCNRGCPVDDRARALTGVGRMLDALEMAVCLPDG